MDTLQLLMGGFASVMQPANLLFALVGCMLGTLVGVLPGIGPAAGTAILIPLTASLSPTGAIIMLAAIYYGAMYGGTITSVLINTPGEAGSAVTCIDGYAMAKRGRAGPALAIAAIGSFVGGTVATLGLVLLALPLTRFALSFGPPEYFALLLVGLSLVTGLASRSLVRGLIAAVLGLLLAQIGTDPVMGAPRFTYGRMELLDGFGIVPVVMGLFGIAEILLNAESRVAPGLRHEDELRHAQEGGRQGVHRSDRARNGHRLLSRPGSRPRFDDPDLPLLFDREEAVEDAGALRARRHRGRRRTRNGEQCVRQRGAHSAVHAGHSELAHDRGVDGRLHDQRAHPGPDAVHRASAPFVWAVIASLYVGNLILLILNIPFIPVWVAILKIPYAILMTIILGFCVIGVYSLSNSVFDIVAMLAFGLIGYLFKKLDIPAAPLVLTLVLGPLMERALRQSLEMSEGDFTIFLTRPLSGTLLAIAVLVIVISTFQAFRKLRGADSEA